MLGVPMSARQTEVDHRNVDQSEPMTGSKQSVRYFSVPR